MTTSPAASAAIFVLAIIALLSATASDYSAEQVMDAERREWMQAIQFCHRTAGPQTAPEYTEDNRLVLVCVGRKGQRHNEVRLSTK